MAKHSVFPTLDLLLGGLVAQVSDVRHALVVSRDGLVISKSTFLTGVDAERLAATTAGLMSLIHGFSTDCDGGVGDGGTVVQTLIEMQQGHFLLTSTGLGAYLSVVCTSRADIGVVACEMNLLATRVGEHLLRESLGVAPDHEICTHDQSTSWP
ncbi:roadblock/LC7 domain-containing protein [Streptomyces sp. NPDC058572]|uniref:roadblock/LC7 domain-containing protein n=1 Tax=Streptomyces sp. NPDC058572 TaxID=3346546 RepID=UPI00364F3284